MTAMRTMLVSVVLLCTSPALLSAGVTGKITGQVTDTHGNPLPGASVVIQGTRHGDIAEHDGVFFIVAVEPGDGYILECSMIGYETREKREVNVSSDFTTNVSFELEEKSIMLDGIVISADALYEKYGGPPVEPDKTTSHYVVTRKEIERRGAIRTVEELLAMQPGVDLTEGTIIRGGGQGESTVYVDGIQLPSNDAYGTQFMSVNRSAVQELTVITGGATAEYGNLEAGVVSVVTREGGDDLQVWTDVRYTPPGKKHWGENVYDSPIHRGKMRWDDPEWVAETVVLDDGPDGVEGTPDDEIGLAHRRLDYTDEKGIYLEGGAAGPIGSRLGFFGSVRWDRQPQDVTEDLSVRTRVVPDYFNEYAEGFPSLHTPRDIQANLKLSFRPIDGLKLSTGMMWSDKEGYNRGQFSQRNLEDSGRNVFLPDGSGSGRFRLTDSIVYGSLTHALNSRTFYELKLGWYNTVQDTQDVRHDLDGFGFPVPTPAQWDADGWFAVKPARQVDFTLADRSRLQIGASLSRQLSDGHLLKTGVDMTYYSLYYYRYQSPPVRNPQRRWVTFVNRQGHMPDEREPVHPIEMAVYVQDKMEFEGMVVNAGLRLDAMYTNQRHHDMFQMSTIQAHWLIKRNTVPTIGARWKTLASPRLGISHAISDRTAFHLSAGLYGRIFDMLVHSQQWWQANAPDTHLAWDAFRQRRSGGNPDVDYTRTRAYEAGGDWNFASNYIAGISAYHHSQTGVPIHTTFWLRLKPPAPSRSTAVALPGGTADMRGLEINLRKGFSHHFALNAALNIGWATRHLTGIYWLGMIPDSAYVMNSDLYHDWQWDDDSGEYVRLDFPTDQRQVWAQAQVEWQRGWASRILEDTTDGQYRTSPFEILYDPQEAFGAPEGILGVYRHGWRSRSLRHAKDHDRRMQISLSLYFESPVDLGPSLQNWHPLGDLRTNLVYRATTGLPYIRPLPTGTAGWEKEEEIASKPLHTWVDLSVEKTVVRDGAREAILYLDVRNLFNQKDSDLPGDIEDYLKWGLDRPWPTDQDYQQYGDYNELTRYLGRPREFSVGLKLSF